MQQSCGGAKEQFFDSFLPVSLAVLLSFLILETLAVHVPSSSSCITGTAYLPGVPSLPCGMPFLPGLSLNSSDICHQRLDLVPTSIYGEPDTRKL